MMDERLRTIATEQIGWIAEKYQESPKVGALALLSILMGVQEELTGGRKTNIKLEAMLEKIRQSDFQILATQGYRLEELMNRIAPIFEEYHIFDQIQSISLLLGMFCAAIEGEPVTFETEQGACIIGFEERLKIFTEVARVAFREAYAARTAEDVPSSISGQRKM